MIFFVKLDLPVYVISLFDAVERRQNMTDRLAALGIRFEFVEALDGRRGLPSVTDGIRLDGLRFKYNTGREMSGVEVACALSHLRCWRRLVASDADVALVMEDDALINDDLCDLMAAADVRQFDWLKLEGRFSIQRAFVGLNRAGNYKIGICDKLTDGMAAYLITRRAASRLFEAIKAIESPLDSALAELAALTGVRILEANPYPVHQDGSLSSISRSGGPPRPPFLPRLLMSIVRRWRIYREHGLSVLVRMEVEIRKIRRRNNKTRRFYPSLGG